MTGKDVRLRARPSAGLCGSCKVSDSRHQQRRHALDSKSAAGVERFSCALAAYEAWQSQKVEPLLYSSNGPEQQAALISHEEQLDLDERRAFSSGCWHLGGVGW